MTASTEHPRPSAKSAEKKGFLFQSRRIALWLAGAVALGFCWGIVETAIIRTVFASGAYFNRDIYHAINGRVIFFGTAAVVLSILLTFAIRLWGRLRRRPVTLSAAGKRALVASAAVAAYVNVTLCLLYFWREATDLTRGELVELGLLSALPSAAVIAGAVLLLAWLRRRFNALRTGLSCVSYALLIAGFVVGVSSLAYQQYKTLSRPDPGDLPDVVVITLDAWRADTLAESFTPEILAYARQNGIIFTEARAASSWTLPSFAAALTGSYNVTDTRGLEPAGASPTTWAEVMRDSGYDTYAVLSNRHLEVVRRLFRGFDYFHYVDFLAPLAQIHYYDTAPYFGTRGRLMEAEVPGKTTRHLAKKTLDILRRPSRRPKFIWVHILDPHFPYQPLPEVLEAEAPELLDKSKYGIYRKYLTRGNLEIFEGLYKYEIKSTDLLVGGLLRELATRPNTVVVISSDHGEEFFEHGVTRHGKTLYEEVCRVPLIIALPKEDRERLPGGESAALVSQVDVAPSVLSYLGLEVPASMEGRRDLLAVAGAGNDEVYATLNQAGAFRAALIQGRKKVIILMQDGELKVKYYDLDADPGELRPLPLDAHGEELKGRLLAWVQQKNVTAGLSAETSALFGGRAELRALGYM